MQTLRFGDEDVLFESLAALKGAVSPLNLIHDEGPKKVNLIVDANIPLLDKGLCHITLDCHETRWSNCAFDSRQCSPGMSSGIERYDGLPDGKSPA